MDDQLDPAVRDDGLGGLSAVAGEEPEAMDQLVERRGGCQFEVSHPGTGAGGPFLRGTPSRSGSPIKFGDDYGPLPRADVIPLKAVE
jgi:hypothetical protein